jgi:hypothetical protein
MIRMREFQADLKAEAVAKGESLSRRVSGAPATGFTS